MRYGKAPKRKAPETGAGKPPRGDSQGERRNAAIRSNVKRHKTRHRRNYVLYYVLLIFLALGIGITLSLTVFFQVESFAVEGGGSLDMQQIAADSGVKLGDNLFRISIAKSEQAIIGRNVLIDRVHIARGLPSTLKIQIELAKTYAVVLWEGQYYNLSRGGRVIRIAGENNETEVPLFIGCDFSEIPLGDYPHATPQNKLDTLLCVADALEQTELAARVRHVDLSSITAIRLYYDDRLEIKMGGIHNIAYELGMVKEMITDGIIDPAQYASVDMSLQNGRYFVLPLEELELPPGFAAAGSAPGIPMVIIDTPPEDVLPADSEEAADAPESISPVSSSAPKPPPAKPAPPPSSAPETSAPAASTEPEIPSDGEIPSDDGAPSEDGGEIPPPNNATPPEGYVPPNGQNFPDEDEIT